MRNASFLYPTSHLESKSLSLLRCQARGKSQKCIPGPWCGRLAVATRPRAGDWLEDEASGWRQAGRDLVVSPLEERKRPLNWNYFGKAMELILSNAIEISKRTQHFQPSAELRLVESILQAPPPCPAGAAIT
jgi:hypothetical protein